MHYVLLGFIHYLAPVNKYCFPNLHLLGEQGGNWANHSKTTAGSDVRFEF